MTASQVELLAQVGVRTVAFAAAAAALDDAAVGAASRLPGWSRGHVLAHVTNQGLALAQVLGAAASGQMASMYPSQDERNAAIEAGAVVGPAVHVERLLAGSEKLFRAWEGLPDSCLDVQFTAPAGWFRPAQDALWFRWRELALHLVDLDAGHEGLDGGPLVDRLLEETVAAFAARDGAPGLTLTATDTGRSWPLGDRATAVAGPSAELAAWLTGRSDGARLTTTGPLPALPPWL